MLTAEISAVGGIIGQGISVNLTHSADRLWNKVEKDV